MRVEIQVHRGAAEDAERIFFYLAASHRQIKNWFLRVLCVSALRILFWTRVIYLQADFGVLPGLTWGKRIWVELSCEALIPGPTVPLS